MKFTKPGTYIFNVTEQGTGTTTDGMTYPATPQTVTVTVADDGGQLSVKSVVYGTNGASDARFTNTYNATGDATLLNTKKAFANWTSTIPANTFKATLSFTKADGTENAFATASNDSNTDGATFSFIRKDGGKATSVDTTWLEQQVKDGFATRSTSPEGFTTWTLKAHVHEVIPDDAVNGDGVAYSAASDKQKAAGGFAKDGVVYDSTAHAATITYTDNYKGALSQSISYDGAEDATVQNTYEATPASVEPTGTVRVTAADGFTAPSLSDVAGKWNYTIVAQDGAPMRFEGTPEGNSPTSITNNADGTITVPKMTFTTADIADVTPAANGTRSKTFTYQVVQGGSVDHITNDAQSASGKTFSVTVTDDGKGTLTANVDPSDPSFTFTNTYAPAPLVLSGDTNIKATMTMEGRSLLPDETLRYTLSPANDATQTAITDGAISSANNWDVPSLVGDGTVGTVRVPTSLSFGDITITRPGTYTFDLKQANGGAANVDYDAHTAKITIEVTDENGVLTSKISYDNGAGKTTDNAAFVNTYNATTANPVSPTGTKVLNGRPQRSGEFHFALTADPSRNGAVFGASAGEQVFSSSRGATNTATGAILSGNGITFALAPVQGNDVTVLSNAVSAGYATQNTAADGTTTWKVYYAVSEDANADSGGLPAGVTVDGTGSYPVVVTIVDKGTGTLDASIDIQTATRLPIPIRHKPRCLL